MPNGFRFHKRQRRKALCGTTLIGIVLYPLNRLPTTVSYTPLDVYKRQVLAQRFAGNGGNIQIQQPGLSQLCLHSGNEMCIRDSAHPDQMGERPVEERQKGLRYSDRSRRRPGIRHAGL